MTPRDRVEHAVERAGEVMADKMAEVKPHLRGWLHAGTFPLSVAAGVVLVVLSPSTQARVATAVFAVTAALLFGVSAVYHRGRWSPRTHGVLKRLDHANIFLLIAGTYTPFALVTLRGAWGWSLLGAAWGLAALGIAQELLFGKGARIPSLVIYLVMGWMGVVALGPLAAALGPGGLAWLLAGGDDHAAITGNMSLPAIIDGGTPAGSAVAQEPAL